MLYTKDKNDAISSFNLIGAEDNILSTARPGEGDAVEFSHLQWNLRAVKFAVEFDSKVEYAIGERS